MKTVESIVKSFSKSINALKKLEEQLREKRLNNHVLINKLQADNVELEIEKNKAKAVADNLKSLIGES